MRTITCTVAVICLVVAGCVSVPLAPYPHPDSTVARITSYNVQYVDRDDDVESHAQSIAATISQLQPDIACLQEVVTVDFPSIDRTLPFGHALSDVLPSYGWVGARGAAQLSVSNPILYRHDRFLPIRQGHYWLSDTPRVPDSTSWGNALPRYATWAEFYDAHSATHFLVVNSHFDNVAHSANERAAEAIVALLLKLAGTEGSDSRFAVPVIFCGDLNELRGSRSRKLLDTVLNDVLSGKDGPSLRTVPAQVDTVYLSADLNVLAAGIARDAVASDHFPVVVDIEFAGARHD